MGNGKTMSRQKWGLKKISIDQGKSHRKSDIFEKPEEREVLNDTIKNFKGLAFGK